MRHHAVLALKPFRALYTIELSKARQILIGLGSFVLRKMFRRLQISNDLINITQTPASLGQCFLACDTHVVFEILDLPLNGVRSMSPRIDAAGRK